MKMLNYKKITIFYIVILITINPCLAKNYLIAMAGGTGERLWPLSKEQTPKQFLSLNNKQTMLEDTLERMKYVPGDTKLWVLTTENFKDKINSLVGNRIDNIVIEPERRDTGPAVLLAAMKAAEEDPNACLAFIPTDQYIPEYEKFGELLKKALNHSNETEDITVLGITPSYPATGYGYLIYEKNLPDQALPLLEFKEKPDKETATKYLEDGNALWNAGIFCGKASSFIKAFKDHCPEIYHSTLNYLKNKGNFGDNPKISVDFAIAEKYPHKAVVPANLFWSDVGDLKTFLSLNENNNNSKVLTLDAKNNLVSSNKKLIALIGISDLCIIETQSELLIVPQEDVQKLKSLVAILKENENLKEYKTYKI